MSELEEGLAVVDEDTSMPASIPAFDLYESNKFMERFARTASYQIANITLIIVVFLVSGLAGFGFYEQHQTRKALERFYRHPPVIREGELGQTTLLIYQDLNTTPDEREVQSALSFWATYHLDHVKATVADFRPKSFDWMDRQYAASMQADDRTKGYIKNILTGTDPQYRIVVSTPVITKIERNKDGDMAGMADIYGHRQYFGLNGLFEPIKPNDAFIVHLTWVQAAQEDEKLVNTNPLGIAVTYYSVYDAPGVSAPIPTGKDGK